MTTIKTSELTGWQLDWCVAMCEGVHPSSFTMYYREGICKRGFPEFHYSSVWHYAGKIIDREYIDLFAPSAPNESWVARVVTTDIYHETGNTALVAAMRCYVASKMGDTVDVPEKLWDD